MEDMLQKMFSLKGHTAIITGATRGIGRGIANCVAGCGADIVVVATRQEVCDQVAAELAAAYGVQAWGGACDISSPEQVDHMIEEACRKVGATPDLLLNDAGVVIHKAATDVTPSEWQKVIDINLSGTFYVSRALGRRLIAEKKTGSIVSIASNASQIVPVPQPQVSYNASKAGVVMMTKSLAMEWAPYGIRVNCINPGYIFTDLIRDVNPEWLKQWTSSIPIGRMGKPEELAGAVVWLFSESSGFATGQEFTIDGGYTCL